MSRIFDNYLVKLFRLRNDDWHELIQNQRNIYFTYNSLNHDFSNHIHFFKRREDGEHGYNIKVNNNKSKTGKIDDLGIHEKDSDFFAVSFLN